MRVWQKTTNMAAISSRALQFRSACWFKFIITRLPKCHFCSAYDNNVDQSQVNLSGKKLDLVVSCLRVDRVTASGLGIGRRFVFVKGYWKAQWEISVND